MRAFNWVWPGSRSTAFLAVPLLLLCLHFSAGAQQAPSREQEQIRRLRQQVQQLQQEQANAVEQSRKAAAEKQQVEQKAREERAVLEQKLKSSQSKVSSQVAELEKKLQAAQAELTALQSRLSETQRQSSTELAQARERLALRDKAYTQLETTNKQQASQLQAVTRNNNALYNLGLELLERYQKKGVAEAAADSEPFLQLKRVQLENLVQDYEDKLEKERVSGPSPK